MSTPSAATIVCGCRASNTEADLVDLIRCGVGEIFAGYVPRAWLTTFGMEVSPNRRYTLPDQIVDRDQLARFASTIREEGAAFVLALNAHYYHPEALPLIDDIVETGLEVGATGFIVADLALLARLSEALDGRAELIVSQEASLDSVASARLFREHGATRLIFARETRLEEMRQVTAEMAGSGVSFEAFVAREFCINSSSRCFACHGHGRPARFCISPTRRLLLQRGEAPDRGLAPTPLPYSYDPGFQHAYHVLHRCGFCAVDELLEMGVHYLKVPGRSSYAIDAARLLQQLLESGDFSAESCRRLVNSEVFCSGHHCYYAPSEKPPPTSSVRGRQDRPSPRRAAETSRPARPVSWGASETPALELYASAGTLSPALVSHLAGDGVRSVAHRFEAFFEPWEREVALAALEGLEGLGLDLDRPPARVQLGMEMCALRLPARGALVDEVERLQAAGLAVSLVLPVAYQAIWSRLLDVVEAAIGAADDRFELVVNDWGLLRYAVGTWPVRLATGRLFNRMKRDQFASDPGLLPAPDGALLEPGLSADEAEARLRALRARQQTMYGYPYLTQPFYQRLLAESEVSSVALDVLPTPLSAPLADQFEHALYLPWSCVAITRACPLAAATAGTPVSHPTEVCGRYCRDQLIAYTYPWRHRRTVQRGAGVFMDCSDAVAPFLDSARPPIQRLVFQLGVPF